MRFLLRPGWQDGVALRFGLPVADGRDHFHVDAGLYELRQDLDEVERGERTLGNDIAVPRAGREVANHGDLSEFNVLLDPAGPVIIDLPQAVNAAGNNNAFRMLERDVNNMRESFGRAAPELLATEYAHEIWKLYEAGELQPESPLTGCFEHDRAEVDVVAVLDLIEDERLFAEERERRREEAAAGV